MRPELRIVTVMPLTELWQADGPIAATRGEPLSAATIRDLLRDGPLHFVIADCGHPLVWIETERCFEFWKSEVQPRLVEPSAHRFRLDDHPDGYCYTASKWSAERCGSVVLCEKYH